MRNNEQRGMSVLRVIAAVFANLTAILSANYTVFYILDHFNSNMHFVVHSEFFLTKYLHLILPVLLLLTGLFYLLVLAGGGFRKTRLKPSALVAVIVIDIVLAGAFAMTVNARAFGWWPFKYEQQEQQPVALATLVPTQQPTAEPAETPVPETPVLTDAPTLAPNETPAPETPTPEPTEAPKPQGITVTDAETGVTRQISGDSVVYSLGMHSNSSVVTALTAKLPENVKVELLGDCRVVDRVGDAGLDGYLAAMRVV